VCAAPSCGVASAKPFANPAKGTRKQGRAERSRDGEHRRLARRGCRDWLIQMGSVSACPVEGRAGLRDSANKRLPGVMVSRGAGTPGLPAGSARWLKEKLQLAWLPD